MLSTAATIEVRGVSAVFFAFLLASTVFENMMSSCKLTRKNISGPQRDSSLPFFLHKLTSIYRQNWSCEEILSSPKNDKAATFSPLVINIASSVQKVRYSTSLHNKSRCSSLTMTSFLTFKIINTMGYSCIFQKTLKNC